VSKVTRVWSGSNLEQLSDEGVLSTHVTASDLPDLSFSHHCGLIASQGWLRDSGAAEFTPWPGQTFDTAMILLDNVIQIFALPEPRPPSQRAITFHLRRGLRVRNVLVDGHRAGLTV
jgi:hypothetical protein